MKFERGKDPLDTLNLGINEAIRGIIFKRLGQAKDFEKGWKVRKKIISDIKELTGYEEIQDISLDSSIRWPRFRYRYVDKKKHRIGIIDIDMKIDQT